MGNARVLPVGPAGTHSSRALIQLAAAPHRLLFFVGASNILLAMAWWAAWLVNQRWRLFDMPQPVLPAGWLHAFLMQYLMLPSFMFGFLLTVFPRWLGQPPLQRWQYAPIGLGIFGGQLATLLGALGWDAGVMVGYMLGAGGWTAGILTLARLIRRATQADWHARSCLAALVIGWLGLACHGVFLLGGTALWAFASIKIATFGLLLPIYLTVAHRMFAFFAASAVPGYIAWRPLWVLATFWVLCLAHLTLELFHAYAWLWVADAPLTLLACVLFWRWWPAAPRPALLAVLFLGWLWLPISLALYSAQSVAYLISGAFVMGRAPAHALLVGFFGSVLVAMVTRVTQGHSGRPLVMPGIAWFAFVAIQLVAVTRIAAELALDQPLWQAVAALGWLVALAPWVARLGGIYLSPRLDGKAG